MSPHLLREHRAFVQLELDRALYGMLMLVSGTQPDDILPWWEILMVEDGADEMEAYLNNA